MPQTGPRMEPLGGQSLPLLLTTGHKVPTQFLATVDTGLLSFKEGWRPPGSTHQGTGPTPASRLLHHTRGGNPQETVEARPERQRYQGRSQSSAGSRGLAGDKHPHAGSRRCQQELWLIIYPVPWTANSHGWRPSPGAS